MEALVDSFLWLHFLEKQLISARNIFQTEFCIFDMSFANISMIVHDQSFDSDSCQVLLFIANSFILEKKLQNFQISCDAASNISLSIHLNEVRDLSTCKFFLPI